MPPTEQKDQHEIKLDINKNLIYPIKYENKYLISACFLLHKQVDMHLNINIQIHTK